MCSARHLLPLGLLGLLLFCLLPGPVQAQPAKYTYWILAEGAANSFFDEEILIGNPNASPASVKITLLPEGGAPVVVPTFQVLATSRYTFNIKQQVPQLPGSMSAVVESVDGMPLVVERTMTWGLGERRGGHNSPGVLATSPTWYLAEGTTGFFNTFILITNPDPARDAQVEVKYLRQFSGPVTQPLVVPKNGRTTIWVNAGLDLDHDGQAETMLGEPFSTVVRSTNGVNVAVERAMYWNDFEGGHESAAVTAPHTTWLFAEGNTGGDPAFSWDTYLLIANPQNTVANITVTFFRRDGGPLTYETTVDPLKRRTLQIGGLDVDKDGTPDLASASFGAKIESTNGVPVVAERAMYWSSLGISFTEGHNTPGVNAEALKWAFADGAEARIDALPISYTSFFLLSNSSASVLKLKATFVREDGKGIVRTFDVPAQSRFTLPTAAYPELRRQRFSAFLESTNEVPFVAERAVYWGAGFYGGHASVGTPWDGAIGTPPAVTFVPTVTSVNPNTGPLAGGTVVTIRGTNFLEPQAGPGSGTRVKFGALDAASVTIVDDTTLTATTPAGAQAGAVDVVVSNTHIDPAWPAATVTNGFTYATNPGPGPNPNPPALPDVRAQIAQFNAERPELFAQQCAAGVKYVNSPWQDYIVDRLRASDPRWGYNGKPTRTAADNGGRPVIAAGDELAYFYGLGNPQNSTDVYLVDILEGHCGPTPRLTWRVFTGEEPGFWTGAGRF